MTDDARRLARLSGGAAADEGATVGFTIEVEDGRNVDIACDTAALEPMIHYMIGLGRLAASGREKVAPHQFGHTDRVETTPIEISDLGLMREMTADGATLVMRMFGFDLGFQVTPHQLKALHAEIERVLPASMLHPSDHHHHHHDH